MVGEDGLGRICSLLKTATGVDFHLYKPATISRRVARRMALQKLSSLKEYVQLLTKDRPELNALYEDIFIHVTSFFRDPDSLQAAVQLVLSKNPRKSRADRNIRVWVPGCSTGEEVYSIAMLLIEQMGERSRSDDNSVLWHGHQRESNRDRRALEFTRSPA